MEGVRIVGWGEERIMDEGRNETEREKKWRKTSLGE